MIQMRKRKKPYIIPAQPQVLIEVVKLLDSNNATVERLVSVIRKDPSLYTTLLAAANTPAFGGTGRVTTLDEALVRIGFNKMLTILRLLSLRNSFTKTLDLGEFWEIATETAELAATLSKTICKGINEEAYSLGMIHNCGIPMMMEAIKGYQVFIETVDTSTLSKWVEAENETFDLNHIQISYEISDRWLMPKNVTHAIRLLSYEYWDLALAQSNNETVKLLLCSLILAKDISSTHRNHLNISEQQQEDFTDLKPILAYVGISEIDYLDIRTEQLQDLADKQ